MVFEVIDTPEKAWLLGWIATDGNVDRYQVRIILKDGDSERYVCDEFVKVAGGKVFLREKTNGKVEHYKTVTWELNGVEECENLVKLGIGPKKSLVLGKVAVPEQLLWHFVRGVFEGDGSVWLTTQTGRGRPQISITSGSKVFAEWVAEITGGKLYPKEKPRRNTSYSIEFGNREVIEAFYKRAYADAGEFVLLRKKQKIEEGLGAYFSSEERGEIGRQNAVPWVEQFTKKHGMSPIEWNLKKGAGQSP
jgi:hypothetical protein